MGTLFPHEISAPAPQAPSFRSAIGNASDGHIALRFPKHFSPKGVAPLGMALKSSQRTSKLFESLLKVLFATNNNDETNVVAILSFLVRSMPLRLRMCSIFLYIFIGLKRSHVQQR